MTRTRIQLAADKRAEQLRRSLVEELQRLVSDAGVSQRLLAAASGVSQSAVSDILAGRLDPTLETYLRLGAVLGADFSAKFFPTTGPQVRDRHQGRILELILQERHARWDPFTEVRVYRPDRGWIDLVLHDPIEHLIVAHEIQSELNRVEQLVRWQQAKAASLPSWEGWPQLDDEPKISSVLIVRRTKPRRTRCKSSNASSASPTPRTPMTRSPLSAARRLGPSLPWSGRSSRGRGQGL
jgi:transcriptional regulator with XRE-family HTH domain